MNSFLRFTVSGLSGSSISQARLLIYANSASSQGINALTVADNSWGEKTITSSNAPAIGSTLSTSPPVVTGTWITFDVTSYITGAGTFSFGLTTSGATQINLASRESGAHSPQLMITMNP
jgi:acid phosphatase type 7